MHTCGPWPGLFPFRSCQRRRKDARVRRQASLSQRCHPQPSGHIPQALHVHSCWGRLWLMFRAHSPAVVVSCFRRNFGALRGINTEKRSLYTFVAVQARGKHRPGRSSCARAPRVALIKCRPPLCALSTTRTSPYRLGRSWSSFRPKVGIFRGNLPLKPYHQHESIANDHDTAIRIDVGVVQYIGAERSVGVSFPFVFTNSGREMILLFVPTEMRTAVSCLFLGIWVCGRGHVPCWMENV